jgi:hypothetical protein
MAVNSAVLDPRKGRGSAEPFAGDGRGVEGTLNLRLKGVGRAAAGGRAVAGGFANLASNGRLTAPLLLTLQ